MIEPHNSGGEPKRQRRPGGGRKSNASKGVESKTATARCRIEPSVKRWIESKPEGESEYLRKLVIADMKAAQ